MRTKTRTNWAWATLALAGALLLACPGPAMAQLNKQQPKDTAGLELEQKPNVQLPLDLELLDEDGFKVPLGKYFGQGKPVILTMNYYSCPMLCTVMLNGMVDALKQVKLVPGTDYEIVTVSINPQEQSVITKQKKTNYCEYWGDPAASTGWHFHTASGDNIHKLADTVGYHYRWIADQQQYAHPAVLMICTPDGRMSRYVQGVTFDPKTVRLALVEASKGRIGTIVDDFTLFCYMYDPTKGSYVPTAVGLMKAGGVLTMLILGFWLLGLWGVERRRRKLAPAGGPEIGDEAQKMATAAAEGADPELPAHGATRA